MEVGVEVMWSALMMISCSQERREDPIRRNNT